MRAKEGLTPPTSWTDQTGLPQIGNLYYPALFMYLHIISGSIAMVGGLVQIISFVRKRFLIVHRIIGNVVCIAGLLTCIFGNLYIYCNGTVGGVSRSFVLARTKERLTKELT